MATYHDGFRTATQLTVEARAAADVVTAADPLSGFLPPVENDTLDYDLGADDLGLPRAASFRSYDSTAPFGRERSVGSRKGSLPASSIKLPLGEYSQLQLRQASDDAIGAALERKALQNGQSVAIRAILARAEAISTGKVSLANENGITVEIDFGRLPAHTVTAATAWTDPNALALTDIIAYQAAYDLANGGPAGGAITSSRVLNALSINKEVIAAATGRGDSGLNRIGRSDVLSVLSDYGITSVIVYDKQYEDVTGTMRRAIADDRFILTPSQDDSVSLIGGSLGSTEWGIPAEALQPAYGISGGEQAGIFAGAFSHPDPEGMYVLASSIFLPVLRKPNATFAADVI